MTFVSHVSLGYCNNVKCKVVWL